MPMWLLSKHLWGALWQGSSVESQCCLLATPMGILPSLFQHREPCEGHQGLCRKPSWGFRDSRATIRIGWPSSPQPRLLTGRREGPQDELCETDAFPGGFLLAGEIDRDQRTTGSLSWKEPEKFEKLSWVLSELSFHTDQSWLITPILAVAELSKLSRDVPTHDK